MIAALLALIQSWRHSKLKGRDEAASHPAAAVSVDASAFGGVLSGADTTVQKALDTLDDHSHPAGVFSAENKQGTTIAAGQPVATHSSTVGIVLAGAGVAGRSCVGLAMAAVNNGVAGNVQTEGVLELADWTAATGGAALTAGAWYYLSATDGLLTTTATTTTGQKHQIVGYALTTLKFDLRISDPILL